MEFLQHEHPTKVKGFTMSINLVNELQVSAEQDDVLTVLRKTKRLASKLSRTDILDWLNSELNGYKNDQDVPAYRQVASTVAYNTNGYVPAGFGMMKKGIEDLPFFGSTKSYVREPISSVMSMIEAVKNGTNQGMFVQINPEIDQFIRSKLCIAPGYDQQISFLMRLNKADVMAIPDQIKDKVLDWACALEAAGVHGEGMSFSPEEKKNANKVSINITNCNVDQVNALGENMKVSR